MSLGAAGCTILLLLGTACGGPQPPKGSDQYGVKKPLSAADRAAASKKLVDLSTLTLAKGPAGYRMLADGTVDLSTLERLLPKKDLWLIEPLEQSGFRRGYLRLWAKTDIDIVMAMVFEFPSADEAKRQLSLSIKSAKAQSSSSVFAISGAGDATGISGVDKGVAFAAALLPRAERIYWVASMSPDAKPRADLETIARAQHATAR